MKRREFLSKTAGGASSLPLVALTGCSSNKEYDLLVAGGTVFDGSGGPGVEADVAVKDARILKIGKNLGVNRARDVIDAKGMAVAPGFIDPHTHTDVQLLANPRAESKIRQGVTVEVGGNCGFSYFPLSDLTFEESRTSVEKQFGVIIDWRDIGGLLGRLEKEGVALNYATFLGQGAVRNAAMGPYNRPPEPDEMELMKRYVRESMEGGALGITSGLEYTPSCFAGTDELIQLCRETAALGGVYATHMRSEEDTVLEALDEALVTARESGVSLQISHVKAIFRHNWPKVDGILAALDKAAREGVRVAADRYPYIAYSTGLSIFFPEWAREGTTADFLNRLKDKSLDKRIRQYVTGQEAKLGSWDQVIISSILSEKNRALEGEILLDAAVKRKQAPYDFMRDILIEEEGSVGMVAFGMSEENLRKLYAHPLVTVGSDGNAAAIDGVLGRGKPHPRFYGTFPRYLGKYVREGKALPLEEAIRKITSFSAEKIGLVERGRIREGYWADLTVFDPDTIIDNATYKDPHRYPGGIPHVIVNGIPAIRDGEHTGALPGKILRR